MNWKEIPNPLVLAVASAYYAFALLSGVSAGTIAAQTGWAFVALVVMATVLRATIPGGVAKLSAAMFLWMTLAQAAMFWIIAGLSIAIAAKLFPRIKSHNGTVPFLPFALAAFAIVMVAGGLSGHVASEQIAASATPVSPLDKKGRNRSHDPVTFSGTLSRTHQLW